MESFINVHVDNTHHGKTGLKIFVVVLFNEKPIDCIHAIIRIHPLITDTQTNTLDW